ncbi:MAG: hypothetical protein M3132_04970 [Actinomycetia bacterium]|nr:hypothetical protein [Actinomycetes bacterium]
MAVGIAGLVFVIVGAALAASGGGTNRLEGALSAASAPYTTIFEQASQRPSTPAASTNLIRQPASSDSESATPSTTTREPEGTVTTTMQPATTTIPLPNISTTIQIGQDPETTGLGLRPPRASGLAVGNGSAWTVRADTGILYRVDTGTNAVVATLDVGGKGTNSSAYSLALGFGSVFVINYPGTTVIRVDTASNEIEATIKTGRAPHGIAVSETAVWVVQRRRSTEGIELVRIDPTANLAANHYPLTGNFLDNATVAVGHGWLWVVVRRGFDGFLFKIDPQTGEIVSTTELNCPGGLMVDASGVWLTDECPEPFGKRVLRIDPTDGSIAEEFPSTFVGYFTKRNDLIAMARETESGTELLLWDEPWKGEPRTIALHGAPNVIGLAFDNGTIWGTTEGPASLIRID